MKHKITNSSTCTCKVPLTNDIKKFNIKTVSGCSSDDLICTYTSMCLQCVFINSTPCRC